VTNYFNNYQVVLTVHVLPCAVGFCAFLKYWTDTVSLSSLAVTLHNSHDKYFTYA
jgi:hypothetical protein